MTPVSRSSKATTCPRWCVGHRVDDAGRSFHLSAMQYAGGLYLGLRQSRRGTGPAVALFRTMSDDNPVVELDEYDATELAEALLETATDLEAATAADPPHPRPRAGSHGLGWLVSKIQRT